jgi:hypothetical protein
VRHLLLYNLCSQRRVGLNGRQLDGNASPDDSAFIRMATSSRRLLPTFANLSVSDKSYPFKFSESTNSHFPGWWCTISYHSHWLNHAPEGGARIDCRN